MGDSLPPQELVSGKYRLIRTIGKGGMGSIWEGIHTTLGTRVAVKFVEREFVDSEEARRRFDNEARAAAQLRSRFAVQVFDHGVMPDGRPFIVMEFLEGESLEKRIERRKTLTLSEVAIIVSQVGRALSKAHKMGIIHRDIKPENVFLASSPDDDGEVAKVVDFGVAKFTNEMPGLSGATRAGVLVGTPFYMSPEQARGLHEIDFRTDLWSLGVVAYHCAVGEMPFDGKGVGDLLVNICTKDAPTPSARNSELTAAFDVWFAKACAREAEDRFQTAQEMSSALLEVAMPSSRDRSFLASSADGAAYQPWAESSEPGAGVVSPVRIVGGPSTQNGATISDARRRRPGGFLGAMIVAALVAIVGLGFVLWRVMGPGAVASAVLEPTSPAASPAPTPEPSTPPPTVSEFWIVDTEDSVPLASSSAAPPDPTAGSTTTKRPTPSRSSSRPKDTGNIDLGY